MASTCSATDRAIFIGFDPRPEEVAGFAVARSSIKRRLSSPIQIYRLHLEALRAAELYWRPTEMREGRLWDVISGAPMATEFAISRFLAPFIAQSGWALFVDADVMARQDLVQLFECADSSKACMVVKHDYTPKADTKMMGQAQVPYARKNWSSVVLWNCDHPKTKVLTPDVINTARGLWLHQFSWLHDEDIGDLDAGWNHLVGDNRPNPDAKLVHFTNGTPNMSGHDGCEFAKEWWAEHEVARGRAGH
jgi:lipopolysaccharide biosynthesis glycosyltransferase